MTFTEEFALKSKHLFILPATLCTSFITLTAIAEAPTGYYSNANTATPTQLRQSVHQIIHNHQRYPYTSSATDTWDILENADQDLDNSNNVTTIYKNASYAKQGGGNSSYNREHSWPKSYGFPNDGSNNYPYTDAHHLFISDSSYNSSRGNKYFDNCTSSCQEKTTNWNDGRGGSGDSNFSNSTRWEVWSKRKGDIARAMFYMDIRYEGGNHNISGASEPDLRLTNNASLISTTGGNASIAYMGLLNTLLQWHHDDPVDSIEMERNDIVFAFQGNRNPFIDHPEWVACIFENQCNGTPDNEDTINDGETLNNLSAPTNEWIYFNIDAPEGASELTLSISGGSGDADLYTLYNAQPTASTFDCRPYLYGNNETCTISSPAAGTHFIGLRAYSAFSNVSLNAFISSTSGSGGESAIYNNLSGNSGSWSHFTFEVQPNTHSLNISIDGGSGDADLYVLNNQQPDFNNFICRPYNVGNTENCTLNNPSPGTWHISLHGYSSYSGVNLTIESY